MKIKVDNIEKNIGNYIGYIPDNIWIKQDKIFSSDEEGNVFYGIDISIKQKEGYEKIINKPFSGKFFGFSNSNGYIMVDDLLVGTKFSSGKLFKTKNVDYFSRLIYRFGVEKMGKLGTKLQFIVRYFTNMKRSEFYELDFIGIEDKQYNNFVESSYIHYQKEIKQLEPGKIYINKNGLILLYVGKKSSKDIWFSIYFDFNSTKKENEIVTNIKSIENVIEKLIERKNEENDTLFYSFYYKKRFVPIEEICEIKNKTIINTLYKEYFF